ncbi:MAG: cytochrome C [Deltaproteobacteria bacterium]|nr:cytochrome C [Deltaproteobacteria bacterium]MCW5801417.1 cytochrome C [Deltaproteobacteria bacterium]
MRMMKCTALAAMLLAPSACVDTSEDDPAIADAEQAISWGTLPNPGPTTINTPVGLAFDIDNGVGTPLQVRKNQTFYINQIDIRASVLAAVDEGVRGLDARGDFAGLDWRDTKLVDQSFPPLPNPDGTFTRRRMYREARWMDRPSLFIIEQFDAQGHPRGLPLIVDTGLANLRTGLDSFFVRRLRAIQWTNDCVSVSSCAGAKSFEEEALVELRYANGPNPNFQFHSATTQLRVWWSATEHTYKIPVEQIANPEWDYGFSIDLAVLTPPRSNGTYAPGTVLDVQFTLRDGRGKRLHNPGQMPSLLDYVLGNVPSGIDYWNGTERVMTYYRRKHRERQMVVAINGPMQNTKPVRETLDFFGQIFTTADGSLVTATPSAQGFFAEAAAVPPWQTFVGVIPVEAPVTDKVKFTLPPDAQSGTYKIVMKARRSYLGEDIPRSGILAIQVGSPTVTKKTLETGGCASCHSDGSDMTRISHAIPLNQRDTCTGCHVPLPFEPEGTVYIRTHFIHSRTDRLNAWEAECKMCHTTKASIQRTSKSACLSCHKSYPPSHVSQFGPIVDMYIGGQPGEDSFRQCTTSCHTNHPYSGL